jgi:MoxR-like ATPase
MALEGLRGKHPLAVVVLPAMVKAGITATTGAAYGSDDELQLLKDHFTVPGAPLGKPYCAVWESVGKDGWRDERYPGRSLQRIRKDRANDGSALVQTKGAGKDVWRLLPGCGQKLEALGSEGNYPVKLIDLAIWYGRDTNVTDLAKLEAWFLTLFPLAVSDLLGTLYEAGVPVAYGAVPLSASKLTQDDYADALRGVAPTPPSLSTDLAGMVSGIEDFMRARHFVPAGGLVLGVLGGWLSGDIVVLVGQAGTGKSTFSALIGQALQSLVGDVVTMWVPVRPDFDEADFLGYERLDGKPELRDFSIRVLRTERPLGTHLVILEECNLSTLENYLSSVLIATSDPGRRILLPGGEEVTLPVDTFFLATCNSYLDEPETRTRLSLASKRRCTIIHMPNVLYEDFVARGRDAIMDLTMEMIDQERAQLTERATASLTTAFDRLRLTRFETVKDARDLSEGLRSALTRLVERLLQTPQGRHYFTLAMLKSVAVAVALADRDEDSELAALGAVLLGKVVHQVRGVKSGVDEFLAAVESLPRHSEIAEIAARMRSAPGDETVSVV